MNMNGELPDAPARRIIFQDLDGNLVVEAAAGTGKTTCLVERLLALFRRGALRGEERLAAVTFTRKAASELRERLDRRLEEELARDDIADGERENLEAAVAALPECHIGTIHSFCGRLLRERPVEAGVGPGFAEIDAADDLLLRRQAWNEFAGEMRQGRHADLYGVFELFGLDQESLGKGFETYAEYPDVDRWVGSGADIAQIDAGAFIKGVGEYAAGLGRFRPQLDSADPGTDKFIPVLQILLRRLPRLPRPPTLADAFRLSRLLPKRAEAVKTHWRKLGADKDDVDGECARYGRFFEETVKPFRRDCLAAVYAAALAAFRVAADIYDRMRRERGLLNFQDLLLITARMLRDFPLVREDLAVRYARLLVDEVQDTDPVQAEIMFLLASSDPGRREWRNCPLRPGSLFIVGDPKQSIYRFRRADIVTYQEMKRLIAQQGGKILGLTANFRSQPALIEWINNTFLPPESGDIPDPEVMAISGRFSRADSKYGPAYVALEPGRAAPEEDCFSGVFALEMLNVDKKAGIYDEDVVLDEAARIARFIRHAVDAGLSLPNGGGGVRPARAGDFLIVTYNKQASSAHASALRRLGLPCLVASGGALGGSASLQLLLAYLKALAEPDNAVLSVAALRGGLFGASDAELYRWKQSGGEFSPLSQGKGDAGSPVGAILARMAAHRRLFRRSDPLTALEAILDDLGLWPHSCVGDDPATGAGALATALELLRNERSGITGVGKLAERLEWLMENHEGDILPAGRRLDDAVRVMNLHKTKGLEAPVVFLAGTRNLKNHSPGSAVFREAGLATGALALRGGEHGNLLLAQPAEWEPMEEEETLFLAAEKTRLNYVAATRAGAALVVSVHQASGVWQTRFLPEFKRGVTIERLLPEPDPAEIKPALPQRPFAVTEAELSGLSEYRENRLRDMVKPSFVNTRGKPDGGRMPDGAVAGDGFLTPEEAMRMGEILHRLLDAPLDENALAAKAAELLRDFEMPQELAESAIAMTRAVWESSIWRRAAASSRVYREVPYTLHGKEDGLERFEHGVIDLVFREDAGWVIVDYKSDSLPSGADPAAAAMRHAGQLEAYVRAWKSVTGEDVSEAGVYFLRVGAYAPLDM